MKSGGSLIDAQIFAAAKKIDHIDKWIPVDQLNAKQHHGPNVQSQATNSKQLQKLEKT